MPVLVVQLLRASPFEVGVVNAAQFVPCALLGLLAGVYTYRWRRKPILVWASVGRAVSLGAMPILWLSGVLQIWMLVIVAPETDGPLELQEDLCRCEHRRTSQ